MKKVSNQELADYIDKSINTINGWQARQPNLLEIARIGLYCKNNGLDLEKIDKLIEVQKLLSNTKKNQND